MRYGEPLYELLYVLGIVFFCFFYVSIIFNPNEVADNMRKYGGFIPGIRSGKPSAEHINDILTKLTLVGGLVLGNDLADPGPDDQRGQDSPLCPLIGDWADANVPRWLLDGIERQLLLRRHVPPDRGGCGDGLRSNQIESQLLMRHYEGFTPRVGHGFGGATRFA